MSGTTALTTEQLQTISNERVKLLAAALDRASTACIVVGIFGPFASATVATLSGTGWLLGAGCLHSIARWHLGQLR